MSDIKDYNKLLELLKQLYISEEYVRLSSYNNGSSFLARMAKESSETIYSKLLSDIFKNGFETLALTPVYLLLRSLSFRILSNENSNEHERNFANKIIFDEILKIHVSEVETEKVTNESRYIDIFIRGGIEYINAKNEEFCIVIENKIFSSEHNNQCDHYYEYIESTFKDIKHRYYIYLSPEIPDLKKITSNKYFKDKYFRYTYQDLLTEILEPLVLQSSKLSNEIPRNSLSDLDELVKSIEVLRNKNNNRLAMSNEYQTLLKKFFESNKVIILEAAKLFATEEEAKDINEAADGRKEYKITYPNGNTETASKHIDCVKKLFSYLAENFDTKELQDKFGDKIISNHLKTSGGQDRNYGPVECRDGKNIYITTQITKESIKKDFIEKAKNFNVFIASI